MKQFFLAVLAISFLGTCAACDGYRDVPTSHGVDRDVECVGFGKDQNPHYKYEIDTRNAVWGIIGCSGICIPTVVWALEYVYCPIGEVPPQSSAPPPS